jgi:hypothetical protein
MKELTDIEIANLAREITGHRSKSGKTLYSDYINSTDELVKKYREFAYNLQMARGEYPDTRQNQMVAEMCAKLAGDSFEYELPALIVLFKRFLTQH